MAKALYRKYRPKTLAEVVGQEQVTDILSRSLQQKRISHAYLFVGPRGTGKTSVARIFAHEINGFPYELEDDYVDIIEIDGASNRGIDDIRELREKATIAPSEGKFKVYIIDEVHMLTQQAFNALLKTLEEPPEHVVFLMATTDVNKVPRTILSRTQNFTFKLAEAETMQKFLRQVADAEGIKITDEALAVVQRQGGGSFRDSLSLLDQVAALSEGEISRELVVAAMGLPEDEAVESLLEAYARGDLAEISEILRKLLGGGTKPELLTEGMIRRILAEPRAEWLGLLARLSAVAAPFPEAKLLVALTQDLQVQPSGAMRKVATRKPANGGSTEKSAAVQATAQNSDTEVITAEKIEKPAAAGPAENATQTESVPAKPAENVEQTTTANSTSTFDWNDFVTKVQEENDAVARQLEKTQHEFTKGELHIYPERKIVYNILGREKNMAILREVASGTKIVLHEFDEKPAGVATNDQNTQQKAALSDIMGGEVIEDGGGSPF